MSSRQTTLHEDDMDMEMEVMEETDEEPQDLENDSPEMRELRLQQWHLKNQLKSDAGAAEMPAPTTSANTNELLIAHYTVRYYPSLLQLSLPGLIYV
jgi:hypothetical protein